MHFKVSLGGLPFGGKGGGISSGGCNKTKYIDHYTDN